MLPVPQDTPVHRASIRELPIDEVEKLIDQMRERRMRQHNAYQEAQAKKAAIKEQKDRDRYEHVLKMFDKKLDSVDKGLAALDKYLAELRVLQIVAGA